jgi:hypothetical protein
LDFLASGLRPRASVVVVRSVGVVIVVASLASGFRPCASGGYALEYVERQLERRMWAHLALAVGESPT